MFGIKNVKRINIIKLKGMSICFVKFLITLNWKLFGLTNAFIVSLNEIVDTFQASFNLKNSKYQFHDNFDKIIAAIGISNAKILYLFLIVVY
jgi:hypothetical protein